MTDYWDNRTVLVTGADGFIGSHLVESLVELGASVRAFVFYNSWNSIGWLADVTGTVRREIEVVSGDIRDPHFCKEITKDIDVIFHLAAKTSVEESIQNPTLYLNHNLHGMTKLLSACAKSGVKRFIFSSSSSVYGNAIVTPTPEKKKFISPLSPYALSKLNGEELCKVYSNAYGERMNEEGSYKLVIPIFAELIKQGKPCTIVNDGKQKRDFVYVEDIVNANIRAATKKRKLNGSVFNIGSGENYSVNELADAMGGEKVYGEKRIEPFETLADITKAEINLGWTPKTNLLNWLKNDYKNKTK